MHNFESFLFRYNEGMAETFQYIGLEYPQSLTPMMFILSMLGTITLLYLLYKVGILEWLEHRDTDHKYFMIFLITATISGIYLMQGMRGVLLGAVIAILVFSFYKMVLSHKKYAWLKEQIEQLF